MVFDRLVVHDRCGPLFLDANFTAASRLNAHRTTGVLESECAHDEAHCERFYALRGTGRSPTARSDRRARARSLCGAAPAGRRADR
jgi:hypothetical protein